MSQPVFKAVVTYPAIVGAVMGHSPIMNRAVWLDYVTDQNRELAHPYFQKADNWLNDNGRQHYINHYDNTDHLNGVGKLVFVFNDRNAAVMFKLAMP